MQSFSWAPEHSAALRDLVGRGMSYEEAARTINAKFGTAYTRLAALGRGKRMGLVVPKRPEKGPKHVPRSQNLPKKRPKQPQGRQVTEEPTVARAEPPKLRCIGISPRLIPLVDLEAGECHYPYGGDSEGEAITFCGHSCFRGSVYCAPHYHLTRGPAIEDERPTGPFMLRLVEAA